MSYSFTARGATVAHALAAAGDAFAKVVEGQPVHAADMEPALGAASVFAELLTPDESKDVAINMNGYLSWQYPQNSEQPPVFTGVAVTISVNQVARDS